MFADSMLEVSWAQRSRRGWSTLTSFALEAVVLATVIVLSLLQSTVLPAIQTVSTPIFAGRVGARPTSPHPTQGHTAVTPVDTHGIIFLRHPEIRPRTDSGPADDSPTDAEVGVYTGDFHPGSTSGPAFPFSGSRPVPVPPLPTPAVRTFRTSSMLEGMLIRRVQPVYPPLARAARIQGSVVLAAVISKAGTIDNLHALSGHPMLVPAAIAAVSQWRYRPYILNSEPIEVETQITVNFTLTGN